MFARVVTWEGADPGVLDATVANIRGRRRVSVEMLDVSVQILP